MSFDNHSRSYKIILLKTYIFEKKSNFQLKKIIWPIFSRIIEYEKHQGTTRRGTRGILTSIVQAI